MRGEIAMIQFLTEHGEDPALVLDRSVLEMLDIDEGNRKYGSMLKRLAEEEE
jgi:hypothetical protein